VDSDREVQATYPVRIRLLTEGGAPCASAMRRIRDAIQEDPQDFLRMMGAAAGVAVGATLPRDPPNASERRGPSPARRKKRPLGKTRVPGRDGRVGAMTTRDPE